MDALNDGLIALCSTATVIAAGHTLLGPDHYLPFVAMAKARQWSLRRTVAITAVCGVGHVLGSVALGAIGITLGTALFAMETIESFRGEVAAWLFIGFGLAYLAWGINRAIRNKPHSHVHVHADGLVHKHEHSHVTDHVHVHDECLSASKVKAAALGEEPNRPGGVTPWMLFTLFILGPCEPLIPLLMYPAAVGSVWDVVIVVAVFGFVTVLTMVSLVALGCIGAAMTSPGRFERYGHALAGSALVLCGVAVKVGW